MASSRVMLTGTWRHWRKAAILKSRRLADSLSQRIFVIPAQNRFKIIKNCYFRFTFRLFRVIFRFVCWIKLPCPDSSLVTQDYLKFPGLPFLDSWTHSSMSRLDVDQVLAQHKSLDPSAMSWPWQEEDENEASEWTKTSMVRVLLPLFHRHDHQGPFVPCCARCHTVYNFSWRPTWGQLRWFCGIFMVLKVLPFKTARIFWKWRRKKTPEDCFLAWNSLVLLFWALSCDSLWYFG